MFVFIQDWLNRRITRRSRITEQQWQAAFARLPILNRLNQDERKRLRDLAILLLHKKSFEAAADLKLNQEMILIIALQACLPILNLGIEWYRGWVSIIVYPEGFTPIRTVVDEAGIAHRVQNRHGGEAWNRGPVILSWRDANLSGVIDGYNLVVHEFSHKLDMLNGVANGMPPLHKSMRTADWSSAFSEAYAHFKALAESGAALPFDDYAATSPAEFFAVLSEVFFEQPQKIYHNYPHVHQQLKEFYRQDPRL